MERKPIARFRDIAVLAVLLALNPLISYRTPPPHIPDKVEIVTCQTPVVDSVQMEELRYYFRNHHVTDEGYNLIANYYTLLSRRALLSRQTLQPVTRHVKAKDRLLPAVSMSLLSVPYCVLIAARSFRMFWESLLTAI